MEKFKLWLKTVGIRTLKTTAEVAMGAIGTKTIGIGDVDWLEVLSIVALSAVMTVLMNIKAIEE